MPSSSTEGRTIVITGGGSGIGRAVALLCAKRGDNVAVLDRDEDAAKIAADEATRNGAKGALGLRCNVASEKEIEKAFEKISEQFGAPPPPRLNIRCLAPDIHAAAGGQARGSTCPPAAAFGATHRPCRRHRRA